MVKCEWIYGLSLFEIEWIVGKYQMEVQSILQGDARVIFIKLSGTGE